MENHKVALLKLFGLAAVSFLGYKAYQAATSPTEQQPVTVPKVVKKPRKKAKRPKSVSNSSFNYSRRP